MPTVFVDGKEIEIGAEQRLNCIEAARLAGAEIPHYCWHPGLSVVASCRMCLIETGSRDAATGKVSMVPKLVPACQTPVKDGTVIVTESAIVKESRARVEEALLIDHPIDCPICDKAGECLLQDYHFEHGQAERRADIHPFTSRRRDVGPTVTLFVDRCVMCTRCVRFAREVSGTSELMVINRGAKEEIDIFPGYPLANKLSGNVVDLCPVGALGDKDFLYQQRVWFLKREDNVCGGCASGCSIHTEHNQDTVYRLKPRENAHVNKWWICDEGRYGWHHLHDQSRLLDATRRLPTGSNGLAESAVIEWADVVTRLRSDLKSAGRLAVAVSPMLTVEEAWMLCAIARSIDPQAFLAVGYVPKTEADESFPGGFTIHAEKCPNRLGVEAVIALFDTSVHHWKDLLSNVEAGDVSAAWITAAYPSSSAAQPWIDAKTAALFSDLECLVVQDFFNSPLADLATWRLPAAGFAERAGTWVNASHRAQSFSQAIRPPAGVWPEGRLFWNMLGRRGLYDPVAVRQQIAESSATLAALAGEMPTTGVDLRLPQLA
ncbi:MAG: 2Fe-2S iron-sulfur cluster-binding protein [Planctomycetia bacterium]|nr:2Fe-2S iron-sulfur cluster-binding protein [Planctomycetia bacterium]